MCRRTKKNVALTLAAGEISNSWCQVLMTKAENPPLFLLKFHIENLFLYWSEKVSLYQKTKLIRKRIMKPIRDFKVSLEGLSAPNIN